MDGYVYVLKYKRLKNLFIVGCTDKALEDLIKEYSDNVRVPEPYEAKIYFKTPAYIKSEKLIYNALDKYRLYPDKKFFQATLTEIKNFFWCLNELFQSAVSDLVDGLRICGNSYFKQHKMELLEVNHDTLKNGNYIFEECFNEVFVKNKKYYSAFIYHGLCTMKGYAKWVDSKKTLASDKDKELESIHPDKEVDISAQCSSSSESKRETQNSDKKETA